MDGLRRWTLRVILALLLVPASATPVIAQHVHEPRDGAQKPHDHPRPTEAIPMFATREASGTAWLPDETAMYGAHITAREWAFMLHGNAFVQFLAESGEVHRRGQQAGSINWIMGMARRRLGGGRMGMRVMASLEPWTVSGCGYPNLLATGEVCDGDTIHDRQHPHDLFMEVAAEYERALTTATRWQIYAGLAGEPALGPVGFPHRPSAMANPIAPITHHWLDSTHISFGVVTAAVSGRTWKVEASAFNGREPDEDRADFDPGALDSFSGRLTLMPSSRLVLQVSAGHLNEAEAEFAGAPRADVTRATASATYHRMLARGTLATTVAWGMNAERSTVVGRLLDQRTHAGLLESTFSLRERHTWFGRFEVVGKPAHDLHVHDLVTSIFTVGKLQGGYVRHFGPWAGLVPGIGVTVSASLVPEPIADRYDGRIAPGFGVFVSLRPARDDMRQDTEDRQSPGAFGTRGLAP